MKCKKCNYNNERSAEFCSKCGEKIKKETVENIDSVQINKSDKENVVSTIKSSILEYFLIIVNVILKPYTTLKEKLIKFDVFKNSMILSLSISLISTLVNLITIMFNTITVKSYNWSTGSYRTIWILENLKDLDYLEIIFKNFLIYLGIIFAITIIYYLASLVAKKQANFSRLLAISSFAVTPMLICSLLLVPILSLIWLDLAMLISIGGIIYTIIILYESINNELLLEGNGKYYFNLVCFSILLIIINFLYTKLIFGQDAEGLREFLDLFN